MTREEMMEVSVQHMVHARLLWNHLVAAEEKIKRLEKEKEELQIVNASANKKIAELQGQNSKVKQERRTLFVADSHRKSVDFKSVQKVLGGELCVVPAYNSGEWPKSRFPNKSHKLVVPQNLALTPFSDMILQLSCNDISNIDHVKDVKVRFQMAEKSTKNSVQVAVSALQQNPTLKQVLILPRSPRKDSEHLSDLSKHANTVLTQEVASSGFKDKIKIGSMDSIKTATEDQIFDLYGSRFSTKCDFLHMRGPRGQELYTHAILQSIKAHKGAHFPFQSEIFLLE